MLQILKAAITWVTVTVLTLQPLTSYAQSINIDVAAPAARQATLDAAANSVPVVNITNPTQAGVSRNKFTDFSVGQEGVILNNSLRVGVSQLGGALLGNPNLTSGQTARIILNEVTGASRSDLLGATEIFGNTAEYVLANPNGITCNGCGFINTPRVTLSTGLPDMVNGGLQGFNVSGGDVAIEGIDLNLTNLDAFDIISRTATVASAIYAGNTLNIITGPNHVDYATRATTPIEPDDSTKPKIAIDSSAFGGMYAGRINLVATEEGVGVKTDGALASSSGNVVITADGNITYDTATSAKHVRITSHSGDVVQTKDSYAAVDLTLKAGKDIALAGKVAAAGNNVSLESDGNITVKDVQLQSGLAADGSSTQGNVTLNTKGKITNTGSITSPTTVIVGNTQALETFANSGLVQASSVTVQANTIDNSGSFTSDSSKGIQAEDITLTATKDIINLNGLIQGSTVVLSSAGMLRNSGLIQSTGNLILSTAALDNSDSYLTDSNGFLIKGLLASNDLSISVADRITNRTGAIAANTLSVTSGDTIDNRNGLLQGAESVTANALTIDNSSTYTTSSNIYGIVSGGYLTLDAENIINTTGLISAPIVNLTASDTITNSGLIQGDATLNLTAGVIDNSNSYQISRDGITRGIISNNDVVLTSTLGSIINSSGAIDSRGLLLINSADDFINTNGYVSSASPTGTSYLVIADYLNNTSGRILAVSDLDITTAGGSNNNGTISSLTNLRIHSTSTDLFNAGGSLYAETAITAENINNHSGVIQAGDLISITNDSGVFDNSSGKLLAYNEESSIDISANQNIINNGGSIISNSNIDLTVDGSYEVTGDIITGGHIDITAFDIINSAAIKAGDYISFILTQGGLINNIGGEILSNVAVLIDAVSGDITNSGEISAPIVALNVEDGNLTNNRSGVISSEGILSISVSDAITNAGRISSGDSAFINSETFSNTGQVASGGALTITTTGNTIHNTSNGLIYANNDLTLHSDVIENTNADIFSRDGNITLEKSTGENSTSITNTSGTIEAFSGDVVINTDSLTNTRSRFATIAEPDRDENGDIILYLNIPEGGSIPHVDFPAQDEFYYYGAGSKAHDKFYIYRIHGSSAEAASILAGNDITISAGDVTNDGSLIAADRDLTLNTTGTLTNNSRTLQEWGYYGRDRNSDDVWYISLFVSYFDPDVFERFGFVFNTEEISSTISAGHNLSGTVRSLINQDIREGGQGPVHTQLSGNTDAAPADVDNKLSLVSNNQSAIDAVDAAGLSYSSSPVLDTSRFIDISSLDNGLFRLNDAPDANYLIESNVEFTDLSRFYGSDYFLDRIGYTPQSDVKLLGDAFYETRLVRDAIFERTGQRYLNAGFGSDFVQMQTLFENAASEMADLNLTVGIALTSEQIAALNSDIIWLVEDVINGQKVLKPVVYLAQATINMLEGGGAQLAAGNNLSISADNGIANLGGIIKAGGHLSLDAQNTIANTGKIKAGKDVTIVSFNGNVINSAAVISANGGTINKMGPFGDPLAASSQTTKTNGAYIRNVVQRQGEIISGGDTTIVAKQNVINTASTIKAGGDITLVADEGSVVIDTAELRNRTVMKTKRQTSIDDTTTHVGSDITAGGNLAIDALYDVNIIGSNLRGENGTIVSQVGGINIKNAVNSVETYRASSKKGFLSSESHQVFDHKEKAVESTLAFNNDLLVSAELGDVNIQGSSINTGNNLRFGEFTIAKNPDGSFQTNADGTYVTVSGDSVQNLNITAAELHNSHWEEHKKSKITLGSLINPAKLFDPKKLFDLKSLISPASLLGSGLSGVELVKLEKSSLKTGSKETTLHASNINVGGDFMANASERFNVAGSNISVGGNGYINAAEVNIASAQEKSSSYSKERKIELGEFNSRFENGSYKAGIKGTGEEHTYDERNVVQRSSNVAFDRDLFVNSQGDVNVIASNVSAGESVLVKTGGNFNLLDAQDTQTTNTENSLLEVEVGAKVGNAYVDVGYAAKALADAQKVLSDANKKLEKMKDLQAQGRASQKAVDLAYTQVAMATLNLASATTSLALSAAGAATAASTSYGTGMYGAIYMDTTAHKDYTDTESSQSVGSTFLTGNNLTIDADGNFNMRGSLLASQEGDVAITAAEANIKAGESTYQVVSGSKTVTAGVSYGNNAVGIHAGYSQSDNYMLSNNHTNSEILAENGTFSLNTKGDTNIKGGNVTANKVALNIGGDLNMETVQDTYEQQGSSFGINVSGSVGGGDGGIPVQMQNVGVNLGMTDIYTAKTNRATGIVELSSNDNNLSEAENLNNLLNSSSVNVAGKIDNQTVKKDVEFTDADFEGGVTVPTAIFTEEGRKEIKNAYNNFGTNLKVTTYGALNTLSNAAETVAGLGKGESPINTFKAKQKEQVIALTRGAKENVRGTLNKLGSKEQNASDIQNALAAGLEPGSGATVYYDENAEEAGFHDKTNGDNYINLAKGATSDVTNATNTNSLLYVDGHERGHNYSSNEGFANMVGQEAVQAWAASNWIYGDSIQTSPNVTANSWANFNGVGNIPVSNVNQAVQGSILHHNTAKANAVALQDRENVVPLFFLVAAAAVATYTMAVGEGNPLDGLETINKGEDLLSKATSAGVEKVVTIAYENYPDATKATLNVLAGVDKVLDDTKVYWDDATGNRVSGTWGEIPEDIRNQLGGALKVVSIVIPEGKFSELIQMAKIGKVEGVATDLSKLEKAVDAERVAGNVAESKAAREASNFGEHLKNAEKTGETAKVTDNLVDGTKAAEKVGEALPSFNKIEKAGSSGGKTAGKPFTPKQKELNIEESKLANNGVVKCNNCGVETVPAQKSQKGITPPKNETQHDHIIPTSKGGNTDPSNRQILCRNCNRQKSDK